MGNTRRYASECRGAFRRRCRCSSKSGSARKFVSTVVSCGTIMLWSHDHRSCVAPHRIVTVNDLALTLPSTCDKYPRPFEILAFTGQRSHGGNGHNVMFWLTMQHITQTLASEMAPLVVRSSTHKGHTGVRQLWFSSKEPQSTLLNGMATLSPTGGLGRCQLQTVHSQMSHSLPASPPANHEPAPQRARTQWAAGSPVQLH